MASKMIEIHLPKIISDTQSKLSQRPADVGIAKSVADGFYSAVEKVKREGNS